MYGVLRPIPNGPGAVVDLLSISTIYNLTVTQRNLKGICLDVSNVSL